MTSPSPSSPTSSSTGSSPVRPRGRIAFIGRQRGGSDDSIDSDDSDYSTRLAEIDAEHAQQEWEEGIEQLYTIASIILLPLLGKYFGRKFAHWCAFTFMFAGCRPKSRADLCQTQHTLATPVLDSVHDSSLENELLHGYLISSRGTLMVHCR